MPEYITKEQALQAVKDAVDAKDEAIEAIAAHIDALTVADVVEVVHGEWKVVCTDGQTYTFYGCSNCGSCFLEQNTGYYCSHCGAKMDWR